MIWDESLRASLRRISVPFRIRKSRWFPDVAPNVTLPKFNSSPLKSYRNPRGKDRLPTTIFQGRAVKLRGCIEGRNHVEFKLKPDLKLNSEIKSRNNWWNAHLSTIYFLEYRRLLTEVHEDCTVCKSLCKEDPTASQREQGHDEQLL